jgi:DNA-directed RNA polymerase alpha subunit
MAAENHTLWAHRINLCVRKTSEIQSDLERIKRYLTENLVIAKQDSVYHLEIPVRIKNTLLSHGVDTVEKLLSFTPETLSSLSGIGTHYLKNIEGALSKSGYTLSKTS